MKRLILGTIAIAGLIVGVVSLARSRTNACDTIIKMFERSATEQEMLATVDGSKKEPLSADDVIKLKHAGVPNSVIFEMLHKSGTVVGNIPAVLARTSSE